MSLKPRLLVIDRDSSHEKSGLDGLSEAFERVTVRTISKALALLRDQKFDAVYVDASQLSAVRWVGMMIQAEEILDAISDGVAVVDPDLRIIWANPEFQSLADSSEAAVGGSFYKALGKAEILGPEQCPFTTAVASKSAASTAMKLAGGHYIRLTVTPVFDTSDALTHLIALTRETTDETQQQLKVDAIHEAGDELADLTPAELAEMAVEERTDLLKYNITRHMRDLLGLDFIEIRLLDRATNRLIPLLTEGMTPLAANRELYARPEGNGVTGFVAATGKTYVCPDTTKDPRYIEGAAGSRSSLTVPLTIHGTVIGTLNVESPQPEAFDERDRQFIEIYGRNIAAAINTLELLQAEKATTARTQVEAINRELALPLDDIIADATTVLDRYAGHDEDIISRLRHLLYRAREIRSLIHKAGAVPPGPNQPPPGPAPRLGGTRLLVVDFDEAIRRSAHHLLGCQGASVETAHDAHEAIALMRQAPYSAALVDIRLPDLDGYEAFKRLREVQPNVPVILMTGFGWDPTHSIVKARQEGLQTVLYKPFRADRLMEAVEQALRTTPAARPAPSAQPGHPNTTLGPSPVGGNSHPAPAQPAAAPAEHEDSTSSPSVEAAPMNDWHWPVALLLVVPAAIGHLCHFILLINVVSGLGYPEWAMDRVRSCIFLALWISSAVLLWMHLCEPFWRWPWPLFSYAVLCVISAVIILPLSSLYLARRKVPAGIKGSSRTIDLAHANGTVALVGDGRHSWLLRLPRHDSFRLCLREWEVIVPGLPGSLDGLQIVQLSDFHFAPCFKRHFFEQVVDACGAWNSDLLFLTGDIVEHDDTIEWIEPVLGRLSARLGKFAVLGNHDKEHQLPRVISELTRAGYLVLEGRWVTMDTAGSAIAIGGTSAPWGPAIDPRAIPSANVSILLSHSPDLFYKARDWGVDLMFSGHNHGGQIRLPLVGAVFVPSLYSRRFDRGFFRASRTLLYVNEGIAGMHPVRYGCYPEITRFVLKADIARS